MEIVWRRYLKLILEPLQAGKRFGYFTEGIMRIGFTVNI